MPQKNQSVNGFFSALGVLPSDVPRERPMYSASREPRRARVVARRVAAGRAPPAGARPGPCVPREPDDGRDRVSRAGGQGPRARLCRPRHVCFRGARARGGAVCLARQSVDVGAADVGLDRAPSRPRRLGPEDRVIRRGAAGPRSISRRRLSRGRRSRPHARCRQGVPQRADRGTDGVPRRHRRPLRWRSRSNPGRRWRAAGAGPARALPD